MGLLSWIAGIFIIVWLFMFFMQIGGWIIHILLVIAVISFLMDLLKSKKKKT